MFRNEHLLPNLDPYLLPQSKDLGPSSQDQKGPYIYRVVQGFKDQPEEMATFFFFFTPSLKTSSITVCVRGGRKEVTSVSLSGMGL